jgi:hypothetical protein
VRVGPTTFRVQGRVGATGDLLWQLTSDYIPPPHRWIPSFNPVLTPTSRMFMPLAGGRVQVCDEPDSVNAAAATSNITFYASNAVYLAAKAAFDASVFINTPLTSDAAGNVYFGFAIVNIVAGGPAGGGVARIDANGAGTFVTAVAATGDPNMVKAAMNSAPALSLDGSTLYVVFNSAVPANGRNTGRLVALDANTLVRINQTVLNDPATGAAAWVSDDATSSPMVGPDGDVYIGVLESNAPGHNFRGWLLHFNAALTQARTPGSFGWDNTPSIVPCASAARAPGGNSPARATR